jgi:hypothetical protein
MEWESGRTETIAELQRRVRATGSFVDRAIVREMKTASERFRETDPIWREVVTLAQRWQEGMPDLDVLEAVRRINRTATCWRAEPAAGEAESAGRSRQVDK